METAYLQTPIGALKIEGLDGAVTSIKFMDASEEFSNPIPKALKPAINQLQEYFEGNRISFTLKLNPGGTDFQKRVWQKLLEIPFGKTVSYQQIANQLGDPKVIRAAASANGKNPISIIIPCHRVIGTDGSLTGYAGGLHRKKWLLAHENELKQPSLF